jgi:Skp family chaperone for outer membrane proteins
MKKRLFILMLVAITSITATAQSPCDTFNDIGYTSTEAYFTDLKNALQQNIPNLKNTRQWARKNNRAEVELATNRLEYWAKKMIQAIDANNGKNQNLLCDKFNKEREYISDFADLSAFFVLSLSSSANNIDYSKYK